MTKKLVTFLAAVLISSTAYAAPRQRVYTATETGLDGDALSGGATSEAIDMADQFWGSWVAFQFTVTAGTTTDVQVTCEESVDGTVWVSIMNCTDGASSTCTEQKLNYDVSTTAGFSMVLRMPVAQYVRCTAEDLAAGSGTVSATATVGS